MRRNRAFWRPRATPSAFQTMEKLWEKWVRTPAVAAALLLGGCSSCEGPPEAAGPVDRSDGTVPGVTARRATGPITLDGRLDEATWREAECTGGFVDPNTGSPNRSSPVNGAAWLAWDDENLYFAFQVFDGNPTSPFQPSEQDPHIWEEASGVEVMLQPGDPGNNRHYYEIQVDIRGAAWTTRFDDYNRPRTKGPDGARRYGHQEWDPQLRSGVHQSSGSYTQELALPWSDITSDEATIPPAPGDLWRINLYTFRDGQRHSLAWSPTLRQGNFHRSSRFGRVTFGR